MNKPPNPPGDMPSGKDAFKLIINVILIAIGALSVFWALVMRKFGTVGTRAYWFDLLTGYVLVIIMSHGLYPDAVLFRGLWVGLPLLYIAHLGATASAEKHVHRHCLGSPRFLKGKKGEVLEIVIACLAAGAFQAAGYEVFGLYVLLSATALYIVEILVMARDGQRVKQMEDAMWEQEYTMANFQRHNKGRM